ncbi:serine/threonine-protein kinase PknG [Pseudonocardia hierapolitana]|uniref:non-specific serine/threonine protein kinase n=1 Tax=Pseudonocardia hierapolitana TaxID=1128676 RepID=A0A561T2B0_9PSEU|nr:serine/threonine-protein kinase [Pseudonocardia hierapolitana]TWF81250.1 serine/threonine-protein kinase PknG [Pseudonocardia hierapolitana]
MTSSQACGRPGCDGTIDGGWCDTCGLAPVPAPTRSAPPAPAPPGAGGSQPCGRPGCDGTIDGGWCDTCGLAPAGDTTGPSTAWSTGSSTRRSSWSTSTGGSRPSRRRSGRTTTGTARSRLGAGLVEVPAVPRVDPASALLTNPEVPENKRFCSTCHKPVGRSKDGRPGRTEGFCPHDGTRFSFTPKLRPGTVVAGQYEVQGCLAHGGLGWIYLATDLNVDNRWVVLKGLLDSGDAHAMAAAVAERRFLAQVSHPNIVTIHNFVQHPDEDGTPVGYIVMEYVGGSSLKQLMEARRRDDRTLDPMPVPRAIAYVLEMLPALGYLHANGLAYCDFKPENVIQYDRQLKLIDLGAVIRFDDLTSAVYGTIGYQAPEIGDETVPENGPSVSSDLHTVGRTLAVLALGIPPARRGVPTPIPDPAEHLVLARHESFHRLLLRSTDPDPLRRFESADEMAEQLGGVLREVLATDRAEGVDDESGDHRSGPVPPAVSTVFGPPRGTFAPGLLAGPGLANDTGGATAAGTDTDAPGRPDPARVAALLPVPLVDRDDPAAALLAAAAPSTPADVARVVAAAPKLSRALQLALVRAHLEVSDPAAAAGVLDELAAEDADDWRLDWFRGVAALVEGRVDAACAAFDTVYSTLPGEAAPKLALAAAAECAGRDEPAGRYYALVARPDPGVADAAFGLARVRVRAGDRAGALAALDAVPDTSSEYVAAQLAAIEVVLSGRFGTDQGEDELRAAAARVEGLRLDAATAQRVRTRLFEEAVELAPNGAGGTPLLRCPWNERSLRLALEASLRASARLASDPGQRVVLVDRANAVRPRTWV